MKITPKSLAKSINDYCAKYDYFWACGLVKDCVELWKRPEYYAMLCDTGKVMADHYLEGRE